jgi:DNA-binding NtrC family response regulator
MRPLHIELLVDRIDREDVAALRSALVAAGHVVLLESAGQLPTDVAPQPDFVVSDGAAVPAPQTLEASEARHIAAVLRFTHGNRRHAAALLGVARSTLLAKVRKYQLG